MLDLVSEWSVVYFKVGGIIGFGIGALAQVISAHTSRDWTLTTSVLLMMFWPYLLWDAAFGERNK